MEGDGALERQRLQVRQRQAATQGRGASRAVLRVSVITLLLSSGSHSCDGDAALAPAQPAGAVAASMLPGLPAAGPGSPSPHVMLALTRQMLRHSLRTPCWAGRRWRQKVTTGACGSRHADLANCHTAAGADAAQRVQLSRSLLLQLCWHHAMHAASAAPRQRSQSRLSTPPAAARRGPSSRAAAWRWSAGSTPAPLPGPAPPAGPATAACRTWSWSG